MSKENLHTLDCIEAVLCRDTPDKVKTQRQEQEDLFANFILISSWQIHEIYREFTEPNNIKQSDKNIQKIWANTFTVLQND